MSLKLSHHRLFRRLSVAFLAISFFIAASLAPQVNAQDVSSKIIGGEFAPALAGGTVAYVVTPDFFCSGALVGRRQVLTAAHCLAEGPAISEYYVYVAGEWFTLSSAWYNAKYDPNKSSYESSPHDLGMLILSRSATKATPLSILNGNRIKRGARVMIAGYGANEYSDDPDRSFVDNFKLGFSRVERVDGKRIFGSHVQYNASTCSGDSGGPALHMYRKNKVAVVGILSAGVNNTIESRCELNADGSFIQVDLQSTSSRAFLRSFKGLRYAR